MMTQGAYALFFISAVCFIVSVFHFFEKGLLLNAAFIFASAKERENLDKHSCYKHSAVVFFLFGIMFLLNGMDTVFQTNWLFFCVIAVMVTAVIFAIRPAGKKADR